MEETLNVTKTFEERPKYMQPYQLVLRVKKEYGAGIHKISHVFQLTCCFIDVLTMFTEQPNSLNI